MKRPKVSVIMPTYNRAAYLGPAIESVLGQTYQDLELIVVDDGSIDRTAEVLNAVSDRRLRTLRQTNRGIATALNTGLEVAHGEFVARNDSDDLWRPELLEALVPVLDQRPDVGLVYGRSQGMSGDGTPLPQFRGYPLKYPGQPLRSLLQTDCTSSIASVVRATLLRDIGGWDGALSAHEDWDMALRIAGISRLAFVDRVVAYFRLHQGMTTAVDKCRLQEHLELRERVLDNAFDSPASASLNGSVRAIAYRNLYIGEGHQWLQLGELNAALRAHLKAVRVSEQRALALARIAWSMLDWFVIDCATWTRRLTYRLLSLGRVDREASPAPYQRDEAAPGTEENHGNESVR